MTIAELGRRSGVGVETVRYYQRLGLIAVPTAPDRSHRRYDEASLEELRFVRRCKELGFSLKQIAVLARLRRTRRGSCTAIHEKLAELTAQLEIKRGLIEQQQQAVRCILAACTGGKPLPECEAFARLDDPGDE